MPGLCADYAWHARCLPASHAAHRPRAGVAHPWPTHGPCVAQAAHRHSLGPSQTKSSDGRENLRGKYGRKIVVDVNLLFSMKQGSQKCLFLIDINKIGIIVDF